MGIGRISIDEEVKDYHSGEVIQIAKGMKRRIENTSENVDSVFIEVQLATYFGRMI